MTKLNSEQHDAQYKIDELERRISNLTCQERDGSAIITMLKDSIRNHEDDYRRLSEGKFQINHLSLWVPCVSKTSNSLEKIINKLEKIRERYYNLNPVDTYINFNKYEIFSCVVSNKTDYTWNINNGNTDFRQIPAHVFIGEQTKAG